MGANALLADISLGFGLLLFTVFALCVIVLIVSLWLYNRSRGPRLIHCPYCHQVIQWGVTTCPNCEKPLTWADQTTNEYSAEE